MEQILKNVRIMVRRDTAAIWNTVNPVLADGEIGLEKDTKLFKFGDGTTSWRELPYANDGKAVLFDSVPTTSDYEFSPGVLGINIATGLVYILIDNTPNAAVWQNLVSMEQLQELISGLGVGDMLKSEYATNGTAGKVDKAQTADKFAATKSVTLTGDATGTVSSDFATGATIPVTLSTVLTGGAGSGLHKITVDDKGRVTAVTNVAAADLPDITLSKVTDAGTAAKLNTGTAAGNVVVVESDGKINTSLLPTIRVVDVKEFTTVAQMLAWSEADEGDIAVVNLATGVEVYILKGDTPSEIDSWIRLNIPTGAVITVNGQSGVVTLTTSNIAEGTNLYYTEARATANFKANLALATELLRNTDTYVLDGGNAALDA